MRQRQFDLIIFGASGYTGSWVVEECALLQNEAPQPFTWAIAGRSRDKLVKTLRTASDYTGIHVNNTPIIIADIRDPGSLEFMTAQGTVLINCVGPYHLHGEAVVQACLATSTNYIDLSAEFPFLERIQLRYHSEAEGKGIYIVGSCAIDSIPADCGVVYLQQQFGGDICSVVSFAEFSTAGKTQAAMGSWLSWVHILPGLLDLPKIRKKLYMTALPRCKYLPFWLPLRYSEELQSWCLLYPSPDGEIVRRSQYHFYTKENRCPVAYYAYYKPPSFLFILGSCLVGMILMLLSLFGAGRALLSKYPALFSFGSATDHGPSRLDADKLEMKFTLVAEGWKDGDANRRDGPPDKKLQLKIDIGNGYQGSAVMAVQAALSILSESHVMPSSGGVYPPGAAFARTTLIDRCNSRGVKFSIKNE